MKKQFLILATITTIVLVSCSKEKVESIENSTNEEIAVRKPGGTPSVSNRGLLGRFEFDSNLKDTTGHLADGWLFGEGVLYTWDRKRQPNHAIKFDETYGVVFDNVPLDTNMSLSIWVKQNISVNYQIPFLDGSNSFDLVHKQGQYQASYFHPSVPQYVLSGPIDNKWHHLGLTRDNNALRFYVDGILVGTSPTPANSGPFVDFSQYVLGVGWDGGYKYWNGSMDDMRVYNRVLSPAEIGILATY